MSVHIRDSNQYVMEIIDDYQKNCETEIND